MRVSFKESEYNVLEWAEEKGILKESGVFAQFQKFLEEVEELKNEIILASDERHGVAMEIGDVLVTLILVNHFARKQGHITESLEECLALAVNKIRKRSGKMVNGVFVKSEDLEEKK